MFNLLKPVGPSLVPANQSPNRLLKPKIDFQSQKLASKAQAPKPKIGQNWLPKAQTGPQSPKVAPQAQAQNCHPAPPPPPPFPQMKNIVPKNKTFGQNFRSKLSFETYWDPNPIQCL